MPSKDTKRTEKLKQTSIFREAKFNVELVS